VRLLALFRTEQALLGPQLYAPTRSLPVLPSVSLFLLKENGGGEDNEVKEQEKMKKAEEKQGD
jgi:hypothetical protein